MSDQTQATGYAPIKDSDKPTIGQKVEHDLYVHLPKSNRFIRYIIKGESWDENKEEMLGKHADQKLYTRSSSADPSIISDQAKNPPSPKKVLEGDGPEATEVRIFKGDRPQTDPAAKAIFLSDAEASIDEPKVVDLNEIITKELKTLFRFMADPEIKDPSTTLESLQVASAEILDRVAPEVANLRDVLLKNTKYLLVMNDAAAITSISIFIAMSHGFTSRKVFHDLSMAVLLMDSPLAEYEDANVVQFYKDPSKLDPAILKKIKLHPKMAHIGVRDRMKSVSENILQLILSHHELYNGEGYPHGIRSESLSTLSRSLSLSVNIFEIMKREHLNGNDIEMLDALRELEEKDAEPHTRRHHRRLVMESINYIVKPESESN
ncbi:hypothetical protein GW916_15475 [bacterium]|nr:hypothetical protein [bacterium]